VTAYIVKNGNEYCISVPKAVLARLGVSLGDSVSVTAETDKIIVTPSSVKHKLTVQYLLEGYAPDTDRFDWEDGDAAQGRELL
jgi:antitoxin component of MazEF toxin-antitoxin module